MRKIISYFKPIKTADKQIYSLDMIRLNIDFGTNTERAVNFLQSLSDSDLRYQIDYYPSFKPYKYRHLWAIKILDDDTSFSIGLDLGRNNEDKHNGFIEFNPNKCHNNKAFEEFWDTFRVFTVTRALIRYDVAIDIPVRRGLVKLIKDGKKMYQLIEKDDGITEYQGQRSHGGFVKVYDKTKESNLEENITRVEITLEKNTDIEKAFPKVHIMDEQMSLSLDDNFTSTERVLISLLKNCDEPMYYYKQLSYRFRKRIEPYLADKVLLLDKKAFYEIRTLAVSYE